MTDLRTIFTSIYQDRGELTPQAVVDEARDTDHPLHDRFEWDDHIAGESYRRVQAQQMIRSVKISFVATSGEEHSVRAFTAAREASDRSDDDPAGAYIPTEDVVQDDLAYRLLVNSLKRDIAQMQSKYGHLSEFAELMRAAAA